MRGRRRGGDHRADAAAPSDRATERLRRHLDREVADLRLQLEEASLRSDAYLHAGYPDQAAEVVDEQRRLLSRFEDRLRDSVSQAAVEAEAERVLAGVPGVEVLSEAPTPVPDRDRPRAAPALASAAAAALLTMVAVTVPGPGSAQLSSAESPSPDAGDAQVAAAGDAAEADRLRQRGRPGVLPAPSSSQPVGRTDASAAPGDPAPSPTERLTGLLEGLVGAAENAIRDALRALLDDGVDPATVDRTIAELTRVEPTAEPALRPSHDDEGTGGDDHTGTDPAAGGGTHEQDGDDAGTDDADGSEGTADDDGSLSDVTPPVQGDDESPYEG